MATSSERKLVRVHVDTLAVTAVGTYYGSRVPNGRKWRVFTASVFQASGSFTMAGYGVADPDLNQGGIGILSPSGVISSTLLPYPITLEAGWRFYVVVDAKTSNGNCLLSLLLEDMTA